MDSNLFFSAFILSSLRVSPTVTTRYRLKGSLCKLRVVDTVTVTVNPLPEVYVGKDTVICSGESLILDAGDFSGYRWQDGSLGRHFSLNAADNYSVQVTNEFGCKATDQITVAVREAPQVELGKDMIVCGRYPALRGGDEYSTHTWSTGSTGRLLSPAQPGKYWVEVRNECGVARDTITVHATGEIFIPNVITPNDDTLNQTFQVIDFSDAPGQLFIFNRWGEQVYESKNYQNDWPGNSAATDSGIYYYTYRVNNCSVKGWVHVMK